MQLKPLKTDIVLKNRVYEALKTAITSMDIYAEGVDTKLDERRLAEELGVSRTPIREALSRLEQDGLIEMIPRRGAFVVRKTKQEILEMICVWGALESLAARLATQHASDAELAGLRKMSIDLDAPNHASANIDEYSSDNIRFHQEIIKLSKCELLSEMAASLFLHMHAIRARSLRGRDRVAGSIVDHAQIIEALEMREAELAERLVREHTEHLSQHVKDYVSWIE